MSQLQLTVTVLAPSAKPISDVKITVYPSTEKALGYTNKNGVLESTIKVTQGSTITVEASGKTFTAQKNILIPRLKNFSQTVLFEPNEAEFGTMSIQTAEQSADQKLHSFLQENINLSDLVRIAAEKSSSTHNLKKTQEALIAKLSFWYMLLVRKNIHHVYIRPVWNQGPFIEVTGRSQSNKALSGFLFRAGAIDDNFTNVIYKNLTDNINQTDINSKILTINTESPLDLRAYANGVWLSPITKSNTTTKFLIASELTDILWNKQNRSITVTADDAPLLKGIVDFKSTLISLTWSFLKNPTE